ncbi:hypothetical protein EB796_010604 [Bugula neritina]|uniref:Uncharacterized protein n=1 Tax=Bugula neritina TaxID=10212 RepID=A0A7J7K0M1_BUGNE|nr:hypothetical protein EB796_010604 [Bugula neritina]
MALHGLMSQSAGSLESTINKAKSVKHRGKLDADIDDAQRRLQHLQMGDQLKEPVLNMDKKLWEEMTSFSQPPADVERVMKAVLLLLGNTEKDVRVCSKNYIYTIILLILINCIYVYIFFLYELHTFYDE